MRDLRSVDLINSSSFFNLLKNSVPVIIPFFPLSFLCWRSSHSSFLDERMLPESLHNSYASKNNWQGGVWSGLFFVVLKMQLHTAKKANCWRIAAVLTIFLGLQLSSCGQSSELREMLGLGRDLEVLFECSSTIWVVNGISNGTYSLLFLALLGLSLWSQKTWWNCSNS